jgi:CDP-diacylglycerol--serine O-phosphatidyltransferase
MNIKPLRKRKAKIPDPLKAAKRRKKRLKYIAFLPSFITLLNGACGFIAIVFASRSFDYEWSFAFMRDTSVTSFAMAGFMLFFAMIGDMLDGRVARLTRTTSSFGGQLDSLTDAISFGAAPAFLVIKLVEFQLEHLVFENLQYPLFVSRFVFFSAVLYVMCAVVRLARFNVENDEDETKQSNFAGIPSPAAAGVLMSLVIFHEYYLSEISYGTQSAAGISEMITVAALPAITLLAGILMVSRIRYPHFANLLFRGKKSLPGLLIIFATGLFMIWNIQLAMLFGFCGYALFGILRWFVILFKKRSKEAIPSSVPPQSG